MYFDLSNTYKVKSFSISRRIVALFLKVTKIQTISKWRHTRLCRSIAEETVGELEKEKTMKELEMRDALAQHRNELAARDALLQGLRDRDHESRATIDLQRKVTRSHVNKRSFVAETVPHRHCHSMKYKILCTNQSLSGRRHSRSKTWDSWLLMRY